eukprot:4310439-Prymnesium_polylepis.1
MSKTQLQSDSNMAIHATAYRCALNRARNERTPMLTMGQARSCVDHDTNTHIPLSSSALRL